MIIEPVPTNPRSPVRHGLQLAGVVLPIVLLVGVVALGSLGPKAMPPTALTVTGEPAVPDAPTPEPSAEALGPSGSPSVWPRVVADLAVRTVGEVLSLRGRIAPDRALAVAGYLGVPTPPSDCPGQPTGSLGPLCERRGMLAQEPWVMSGGGVFAPIGAHLHPRFPVGVRLAEPVAGTTRDAGGGPVPVVLVGRFEPDGDLCRDIGPECEARFLVDQLAWVNGAAFPVRPVIDDGVDGNPAEWMLIRQLDAEVAAIGWSGTVLVSALLHPETVARVDPAAADALAAGPRAAGLVWYVRGLETDYDPTRYPLGRSPPRLAWVVLDDVTGEVLARS